MESQILNKDSIDTKQTDAKMTLQQEYGQCLNTIFSWGVFRNKSPVNRKDLNLSQMMRLSEHFGSPHRNNFKVIHVAGTNGKGTVSLKTAKGLQELGFKVGLFTSPHINTFRERIQVNGEICSMENIVETCKLIFKAVETNNYDVRFFEIVTMIGLLEFKRAQCDYVVLECGLGGALDATNIIDVPELVCSSIISIGLDHMDVLGNSIDDIAAEKSGVIKNGAPCVIGPSCQGLQPISERAKSVGNNLVQIEQHETYGEDNDKIVEEILKIVCLKEQKQLTQEILEISKLASQPCRFEIIPNRPETIILDVCHNIDGFQAVLNQISKRYPLCQKIKMVFGISKSKVLDDIIHLVESNSKVSDIYVVSRPHMRLQKSEVAHKLVADIGSKKLRDVVFDVSEQILTKSDTNSDSSSMLEQGNNIPNTLDYLLKENKDLAETSSILLICGSFFIMSDVKQYFGFKQEIDNIV